jgi:hypothetical protein
MGPSFHLGVTRIGRERLPANHVAILDDPALLLAALRELHAYALTPAEGGTRKICHSIVFRVADAREVERFNYKLQQLLGVADFMDNAAVYAVRAGHWHVVDSEQMTHVCNRHSDATREAQRGHFPVTVMDFERIPDVVAVHNIAEFERTKGMPRIVYRKRYGDGQLTVGDPGDPVEEFDREDDVQTKVKAVGDIRLADGLSTARLYVRNGPVCATTFCNKFIVRMWWGQSGGAVNAG